jgi:Yip1 domain
LQSVQLGGNVCLPLPQLEADYQPPQWYNLAASLPQKDSLEGASMSSATAALPSEDRPLSEVERVVDTFVAPSKTFTDIRRSASWWLPWLLGAIVGAGMVFVVDKKVGMEKVSENRLALTPKQAAKLDQLQPEQRARQMELTATFTRYFAYGFPLFNLLLVAIIAAVLLGTFNFGFGAELKFAQCYALSMYAFLPGIIKALLAIMIVLVTGGENFTFENPVASNLGALVDPSSTFLYSVASSIDVFTIWILVLTAIGYSCITRVKRSTCYAVIFGWWIVNTLLWSGVAAVFS